MIKLEHGPVALIEFQDFGRTLDRRDRHSDRIAPDILRPEDTAFGAGCEHQPVMAFDHVTKFGTQLIFKADRGQIAGRIHRLDDRINAIGDVKSPGGVCLIVFHGPLLR